jgi:hypothetical protein
MKTTAKDYMERLARKGEVTILERPQGKVAVAVKARGSILTLEGGQKDKLVAELLQICKDWPDIYV